MKRWWWIGTVMLVLGLASSGASQQNVMVLYGSPDRDWVAAIAAKFEKDTGIKTPWIRASSNEITPRSRRRRRTPRGMFGSGAPAIRTSRRLKRG